MSHTFSIKARAIVTFAALLLSFAVSPKILIASEAVQFFIKADEQALCAVPLEITVLALDQSGSLVKEYQGEKAADVQAQEEGGLQPHSYSALPKKLDFKEGVAVFSITDSEAETLEIRVRIADAASPFPARIAFHAPSSLPPQNGVLREESADNTPPRITDVKMYVQSIIELYFDKALDDTAATDVSNYQVVCSGYYQPRSVEVHENKVILQMGAPMPEHAIMHIEIRNIKDTAGNMVSPGTRSPDYEVPCCGAAHS